MVETGTVSAAACETWVDEPSSDDDDDELSSPGTMRDGMSLGNDTCEVIVTDGLPLTIDVDAPCCSALEFGAVVVTEPDDESAAEPDGDELEEDGWAMTSVDVGTHSYSLLMLDELVEADDADADAGADAADDELAPAADDVAFGELEPVGSALDGESGPLALGPDPTLEAVVLPVATGTATLCETVALAEGTGEAGSTELDDAPGTGTTTVLLPATTVLEVGAGVASGAEADERVTGAVALPLLAGTEGDGTDEASASLALGTALADGLNVALLAG